jgi:hypothetical protein
LYSQGLREEAIDCFVLKDCLVVRKDELDLLLDKIQQYVEIQFRHQQDINQIFSSGEIRNRRMEIANILIRSIWPANTHRAYFGANGWDQASFTMEFHTQRYQAMTGKYRGKKKGTKLHVNVSIHHLQNT